MKTSLSRKEFMKLAVSTALTMPAFAMYGNSFGIKNRTKKSTDSNAEKLYASHPGLQLYTVRESFSKDPEGTLKKVAKIGFKDLEFFDPAKLSLAGQVKDLGMKIISTHFQPGYITGNWSNPEHPPKEKLEDLIEMCVKVGVKNLGVGFLYPVDRKSLDDYKRFAEKANQAGEKSKAAGVQLYYHNHSFEFKPTENTTPMDAMLAILDKDLVKLELDVFWTSVAGKNPTEWIQKLKGRVKFLHLKDLKKDTPVDYTTSDVKSEAFVALGDGVVDFKSILNAAHATDIPYAFVEQDHSAIDPFESITKSLHYLKGLGL